MTDIKALIAQRVPQDRILDRPALAALAKEIGGMPELWRHLVQLIPNERHFAQLYREPAFDIWMLCSRIPPGFPRMSRMTPLTPSFWSAATAFFTSSDAVSLNRWTGM